MTTEQKGVDVQDAIDARRYRFLRNDAVWADSACWAVNGSSVEDAWPIDGLELDAAIDAEIEKAIQP